MYLCESVWRMSGLSSLTRPSLIGLRGWVRLHTRRTLREPFLGILNDTFGITRENVCLVVCDHWSLTSDILSSSSGVLLFHIWLSAAAVPADLPPDWLHYGLEAEGVRGRRGGRPRSHRKNVRSAAAEAFKYWCMAMSLLYILHLHLVI